MPFQDKSFDFANMDSAAITAAFKENNIVLTVDEAHAIQKMLQRPPTLTECLLWSIQSSEHCSYKSSRQHLKQLPTDGPEVILGPKEDAGIISVAVDNTGKRYGIAMSHESHNHPSQIVPFEGAATGVGGNVRDVCCMGAEVIAVSDSLRFGEISNPKTKWIHEGVVAGIASYGNSLGVPNLGGDLYYDSEYNDNCLVTVVTLGIVREDQIIHSAAPKNAVGYDLILVGKPTDNSGFAGASFASIELEEEEKEQNRGAVQEPNAFLERHLLKSSYALFKILKDKKLLNKVGFKDLGAGGIACASVELAEAGGYGAIVDIDEIPVSMENLAPAVILCSETQERFMWVVHPDVTPLILQHYNETFALPKVSAGAQAKVIGTITADKNYIARYKNQDVIHAKASDITQGIAYDRPCDFVVKDLIEPNLLALDNHNETLLRLLAHENIASRKPVFETYDKQVQGRTVIESGQADAGVMQPFNSKEFPAEIRATGIALSTDHNPRFSKIDPYWGAINAVAEAVRNVATVGAQPLAITDCLCFGNPEKPEQMGDFVVSVKGVAAVCNALELPIIGGNVSFYNESKEGAIPPSPIISCLGKLADASKSVDMTFKQIDSLIIMLGERKDECGGSAYYAIHNQLGANVPKPNFAVLKNQIALVADLVNKNLILAAHDIADGGIAVTLAEMSFGNSIGCDIDIPGILSKETKLFSETGGFVLEITQSDIEKVRKIFSKYKLPVTVIGRTIDGAKLRIQNCIELDVADAKSAWSEGLRNKL